MDVVGHAAKHRDDEIAWHSLDIWSVTPVHVVVIHFVAVWVGIPVHNDVADLYVRAFEEAAGGPEVASAVLREVAGAAADVGIEPGGENARELARHLAEVDLHE